LRKHFEHQRGVRDRHAGEVLVPTLEVGHDRADGRRVALADAAGIAALDERDDPERVPGRRGAGPAPSRART
jgi:hypothetical protein